LLSEFLDFVDQKAGAGPIRAEWALDWACMLSPRRGVGGQAGRLSVVRNFLTYLRAFIVEGWSPCTQRLQSICGAMAWIGNALATTHSRMHG
jgi:hypothetical protein